MLKNAIITLSLLLSPACHVDGEDVSPATARQAEVQVGQSVTIELGDADVPPEQFHAIAQSVESLGDVTQAKVKVKKTDAGSQMELELWGSNLPDQATIETKLKGDFPVLADASISVAALDAASAPSSAGEGLDSEDPEVAKEEIIQRLRDDGVEGDIHVDIKDGENGREVEVRVEKKCTSPDECE